MSQILAWTFFRCKNCWKNCKERKPNGAQQLQSCKNKSSFSKKKTNFCMKTITNWSWKLFHPRWVEMYQVWQRCYFWTTIFDMFLWPLFCAPICFLWVNLHSYEWILIILICKRKLDSFKLSTVVSNFTQIFPPFFSYTKSAIGCCTKYILNLSLQSPGKDLLAL